MLTTAIVSTVLTQSGDRQIPGASEADLQTSAPDGSEGYYQLQSDLSGTDFAAAYDLHAVVLYLRFSHGQVRRSVPWQGFDAARP